MIQIEFISPKKNAEIVRSVNGQIGDVVLDIPKIDGLATEEYVAKKIAEAQMEGADVDLSDYYTKSEVDAAIEEIELTPGPAGEPGKDGEDYVLTEEDKAEIAGMVEVPGSDCPIKAGSAEGSALLPGGYGAGSAAGKYSFSTGGGSARGDNSVALAGNANNDYSIAIGSGTKANKAFQVAIGYHNEADNTANVVIGNGYVTPDYTFVLQNAMACYGEENTVHFPGKVVLGENKEEVATKAYVDANAGGSGEGGSVSVDGTTIVQNEDGTISATAPIKAGTGTDSIMTSNANSASNLRSLAIGYNASSSGAQAMAVGSNTEASAASAIAIGLYTKATFDSAIGIGSNVEATGKNSLALGHSAKTVNNGSYAIGSSAQATSQDTMAIGHNSKATADSAYAFGTYVTADTAKQMVIGRHNVSDPTATFIIGNGANTVEKQNAMVVDADNQVNFPGSVTIGADKAEVATKAFVEELLGVIENGTY
jgi:hypothetical protein